MNFTISKRIRTAILALVAVFSPLQPLSSALAQETASLEISDTSFRCLTEMTKVRGFFVDNLMGDLDATIAIAEAEQGVYPPGSVVQLVPGEVMVKHPKGFNAATKDWEFFELNVNENGSEIGKRGFVDVVNKFGGNCFACHIQARPEFDLICEQDHGCEPIALTRDMISLIQKTDPRCSDNPELSPEDQKALSELLKTLASQDS